MKKTLALLLAMMMVLALCACGAGEEAPVADAAPAADAVSADVTWADYQAYLIEKAGANAPDLAEFEAQVNAINSWDELDQTVSPWDQMFSTIGLSTWDEFAAGNVKDPAVSGSSGDASGEPAAEGDASGEPSGEAGGDVPASASVPNEAHGGTAGATTEADYQAYLKDWLTYEKSANTTMDDTMLGEFTALIDAGDYTTFPADMLFNGMLTTGSAMTYDEFVAANGIY